MLASWSLTRPPWSPPRPRRAPPSRNVKTRGPVRVLTWLAPAACVVALTACNAVLGLDAVETRGAGASGGGGAAASSGTAGGGGVMNGCGTGGAPSVMPGSAAGGGAPLAWSEVPVDGGFEMWSGTLPDQWPAYNGTVERSPCPFHGDEAVRLVMDEGQYASIVSSAIAVSPGDYVFVQYSTRLGSGKLKSAVLVASANGPIETVQLGPGVGAWSTQSDTFQIQAPTTAFTIEIGAQDDPNTPGPSSLDLDDVHVFVGH